MSCGGCSITPSTSRSRAGRLPTSGSRPIQASDLSGRAWLLREEGSGTRALNDQFLAEHSREAPTLTLGSNGAIKQAARAGLGVSLLSRAAVATELEAGLLGELRLKALPPPRPWFVLRSAVGPVRPAVEEVAAFVREST